MVRKTITLPESTVDLVRKQARDGESFSATIARLLDERARGSEAVRMPSYVGAGEGPADLSARVEEYLRELVEAC
jgi:hypothetical protein